MIDFKLTKIPRTTYTYSVTVGGETVHPCELYATLWLVRKTGVEMWGISQKKIDALNAVGAFQNAIKKQIAKPGPNIDAIIADLATMIRGDSELHDLWARRYAEDRIVSP